MVADRAIISPILKAVIIILAFTGTVSGGELLLHIDFENWAEKPSDKLVLKEGAKVVHTYEKAHSGEACLQVDCFNKYYQYSLETEKLQVKPGGSYELSFFYRHTPKVGRYGINVYVFAFGDGDKQLDAKFDGWAFDEVSIFYPIHMVPENNQWLQTNKKLIIPEGVTKVKFLLRHASIPVGEKIYLDDIAFKESEPEVFLSYEIDPERNILSGSLKVTADIVEQVENYTVLIREYDEEKNKKPVFVSLKPRKYNTDYSIKMYGEMKKKLTIQPRKSNFTVDLSDLEDGHGYTISAMVTLEDGREIVREDKVENSVFYVFKKPYWENNRLGYLDKDDLPPPPWSPVKYNQAKKSVTTWNNRLLFDDSLMLKDLKYKKPRLHALTGTMEFHINGKKVSDTFKFGTPELTYDSPNRIVLSCSGQSDDFGLEIRADIEFDGFLKYHLELIPKQGTTLDKFSLKILFPDNFVKYIHTRYQQKLLFGPEESVWETKELYPSIWVGNFDTGICWCADTLIPSVKEQSESWAKLSRQGSNVIMDIHLVNQPIPLKRGKPLDIDFGLLPTPTRPMYKNYRDIRMRAGKYSNLELLWSRREHFTYSGFPIATDDAPRKWLDVVKPRSKDMKTCFYLATSNFMTTIPEATYFRNKWENLSGQHSYDNEMSDRGMWSGDFRAVDITRKSWQDLFCYKLDEFLRKYPFDGLYFDCSGAGGGVASAEVVELDGKYLIPIFENREFHKRIYVILKRHVPDAMTIFHSITNSALPYASFSDFVCTGEYFRTKLGKYRYYLDFLSLEGFHNEVATNTGQAVLFLPQYRQLDKRKDPKLACHTMGLVMLHDMLVWPSWMNRDIIDRMRERKYRFGSLIKHYFFPYWDDRRAMFLKCDNPEIVYSLYTMDGNLFVILFNRSDKTQKANLNLSRMVMNDQTAISVVRKAIVYDPIEDRETVYQLDQLWDHPIKVSIEPYLTKLLIWK